MEELEGRLKTKVKKSAEDPGYFGLTDEDALDILQIVGLNVLSEKKTLPWPIKLMLEFTGLFNYLLWAGAILCFIAYALQVDKSDKSNLYLGIVIIIVILITGLMAFMQSSKTAAIMASFKNFIPPKATVWRNGKKKEINAKELVPGDVVEINIGENIPADVIIIKSSEMKVNNASLTGESEELLRVPFPKEPSRNIFEAANVAFFGTACTNGSGTGVVFKTGDNTVIGQIASLAQTAEAGETLISIEIGRFVKMIAAIAISMGVIFFIINIIYGSDIIANLIYCIGILVANIPEGLQITVTVSMALSAKKMAARKVLVKNLQSVETLGCTSCICSDKTGTLTQNKMTVSHLYYGNQLVEADINYEQFKVLKKKNDQVRLGYDMNNIDFKELHKLMSLGSKAAFNYNPSDEEIVAEYKKTNKLVYDKKKSPIDGVPKDKKE